MPIQHLISPSDQQSACINALPVFVPGQPSLDEIPEDDPRLEFPAVSGVFAAREVAPCRRNRVSTEFVDSLSLDSGQTMRFCSGHSLEFVRISMNETVWSIRLNGYSLMTFVVKKGETTFRPEHSFSSVSTNNGITKVSFGSSHYIEFDSTGLLLIRKGRNAVRFLNRRPPLGN